MNLVQQFGAGYDTGSKIRYAKESAPYLKQERDLRLQQMQQGVQSGQQQQDQTKLAIDQLTMQNKEMQKKIDLRDSDEAFESFVKFGDTDKLNTMLSESKTFQRLYPDTTSVRPMEYHEDSAKFNQLIGRLKGEELPEGTGEPEWNVLDVLSKEERKAISENYMIASMPGGEVIIDMGKVMDANGFTHRMDKRTMDELVKKQSALDKLKTPFQKKVEYIDQLKGTQSEIAEKLISNEAEVKQKQADKFAEALYNPIDNKLRKASELVNTKEYMRYAINTKKDAIGAAEATAIRGMSAMLAQGDKLYSEFEKISTGGTDTHRGAQMRKALLNVLPADVADKMPQMWKDSGEDLNKLESKYGLSTALFIKAISGAAVTEEEFTRLQGIMFGGPNANIEVKKQKYSAYLSQMKDILTSQLDGHVVSSPKFVNEVGNQVFNAKIPEYEKPKKEDPAATPGAKFVQEEQGTLSKLWDGAKSMVGLGDKEVDNDAVAQQIINSVK